MNANFELEQELAAFAATRRRLNYIGFYEVQEMSRLDEQEDEAYAAGIVARAETRLAGGRVFPHGMSD